MGVNDIIGENLLQLVNIKGFIELLDYRGGIAGNPKFQFGIEVEAAGRFDAEMSDALIRIRMVFDFLPREPLAIDKDQPFYS